METGPKKLGGGPGVSWSGLFKNVSRQGTQFNSPIAANNWYYAFLSKVDYDQSTGTWSVAFEVQPAVWTVNVFQNGSRPIKYRAPLGPASIFHMPYASGQDLLAVLGLKDPNDIAEGTWYNIKIVPKVSDILLGIFYNPDIDTNPTDGSMMYGDYNLTDATLEVELVMNVYVINNPVPRRAVDRKGGYKAVRSSLVDRYVPYGKKQRFKRVKTGLEARLAVTAPITSIGAMDIGQGNCNLLLDTANEPFTYFDLGYPLWFYVGSLPANMNYANLGGAYMGPITQNPPANDLEVVLSHWDWDHWRLGKVANMNTLRWIVPYQPIGGSALAFYNSLTNVQVYNNGPFNGAGGTYDLYRCAPGNLPAAAVLNNTGIAMNVHMKLPVGTVPATTVLMTGDANFSSIQGGPFNFVAGIEAVHHGSNAHGASGNLPAPIGGTPGRIFYSYGLRMQGGVLVYVYGFPVPAAVNDYHVGGWTIESATAEGTHIRALPTTQANRGNVRVGDPAPLPGTYAYSAFSIFPPANAIN